MTITAGSLSLLTICGAIILTAIPAAQMKISPSNLPKISSTKSASLVKFLPFANVCPPTFDEIFSASRAPFAVNDIIAVLNLKSRLPEHMTKFWRIQIRFLPALGIQTLPDDN